MTNLNLYEATFAFKPRQLSQLNYCPSNCPTQIKGLFWIENQPFWTYQCLCCQTYQFKEGKITAKWGEIYE